LSQFDSGQGDATRQGAALAGREAVRKTAVHGFDSRPRLHDSPARSTKDVRLPPKQTGASSSLAEPARPVFRCRRL